MKTASAKDAEGIAGHKKEVEGYRKEVEKIYGYINGQGLAHSFSERQKQLKWPLIIWSIMLFASTCLVSWALYEVFRELPIDTMTGKRIFEPSSLFFACHLFRRSFSFSSLRSGNTHENDDCSKVMLLRRRLQKL